MNYKRIYDQIIDNRKQNSYDGYTENHHIIPRSLGGNDDVDNIVSLSAREHFICHYLLAKMYPKESFEWYKMNHAFIRMKSESYNQDRYYNSKLYEALRGNFSSVMSYVNMGNRNPNYGTRWIHSMELKQSKRIKKDDPLPEGWLEGRIVDFDKKEYKLKKQEIEKQKKEQIKFDKWNSLYREFKLSNLSLNKFAKSIGTHQPHLTNKFRKYVEEYRCNVKQRYSANKILDQ